MKPEQKNGVSDSEVVRDIPLACSNEHAAVEFMEKQRWCGSPACPRCNATDVYKMLDRKTGQRNKRFLWKCNGCGRQFNVRIGTVFEESRIPIRHWCMAFWLACSSKKGCAAKQIERMTGLSYKSALFMMHRIRHAMDDVKPAKLTGDVEADEVYIGGKHKTGRSGPHDKTPVLVLIQRGGDARLQVLNRVTSASVDAHIRRQVLPSQSTLHSDELNVYRRIGYDFKGGHKSVMHSIGEYYRHSDGAGINTCESLNAIIKRGLNGVYHSVSVKHLHRYLAEYQFRWNRRLISDGERLRSAIQAAVGKRLMYRDPIAPKKAENE